MNVASQNESPKGYLQGSGLFDLQMLLRVAWLGFIAASLTACCGAREITPEYGQERATLNGRDVVVSYFKNVRRVQQSSPDICWAAALELALAHQGVDTDQNRIVKRVYPKADAVADRRLNMFWWRQELSVTSERLLDGSEVYARNDLDGGVEGLILSSSTFTRKITFELVRNRIPLVGITTGRGGGHIVAVVGAAFPSEVKRLTPSEIVGFLIYDPLTAQPQLLSTEKLFELSTATLVYVSTYDNAWRAIGGEYCSPKKR